MRAFRDRVNGMSAEEIIAEATRLREAQAKRQAEGRLQDLRQDPDWAAT